MSSPFESRNNVTQLPRGGRDGFFAETAIRFDQLEKGAAHLQARYEEVTAALEAARESAAQAQSLRAFEESLRNSREYKIEEILRATRETKSRLDQVEGERTLFLNLPFKTWEQVNTKLQDLDRQVTAIKKRERISNVLAALGVVAIAGSAMNMLL